MKKTINIIRAVILFIVLIFVLIFCFQNKSAVQVKFLTAELENVPVFIILFATLAGGVLIGYLAGMLAGTKSKRATLKEAEEKSQTLNNSSNTTNT